MLRQNTPTFEPVDKFHLGAFSPRCSHIGFKKRLETLDQAYGTIKSETPNSPMPIPAGGANRLMGNRHELRFGCDVHGNRKCNLLKKMELR